MADLNPPPKPPRGYGHVSVAVLAVVAVFTLAAAWGALVAVERISQNAVERALFLSGEDWAAVETNGLQVILSGDAPSEAARFAALSAAGHEVDGARVIDQMVLPEAVAIEPPRFSVEMLRNEAGISLIGLIPAETDREALTQRMRAIDPLQPVADFLETAEFATPPGWDNVLDFSLEVAGMLPRSKISMSADNVSVEGIAPSADQKREWEQQIRRDRPAGLRLALDIRAPLDVISPYIVRFLADEDGARFDACTAYTPADRNRIISAGIAAGVKGAVDCTIGLGVPSPDWPEAVARGISAIHDMGGGSLTFSDADVTLIAPAGTPQNTYDRVIGELEADLPDVFSLHGVLSEPDSGVARPAGTPEFVAALAESGAVQLRGRVASEQDRTVVETLARARFGTRAVYAPLSLDPALPSSWAVRTLAGLEALDQLADGRVVVRPDIVTVSGTTGDRGASAAISRLLSEKLGEAEDFRVNVTYEEELDPVAAMPTPQECATDVNAVLARSKITFAPGSAEIERGSTATVDRIAEILKTCPDVAMEIGGYTDSQGREEMNQALSQRRAEAVVSALLARRVLTTNLKAFGYGEADPIADNETEEGREANRRIEFSLIGEARTRAEPDGLTGDDPAMRAPERPGEEETDADESGGAGEDVAPETAPDADPDAEAQSAAPDGADADGATDEAVPADADSGEAAAPEADDPTGSDAGDPAAPEEASETEAAPEGAEAKDLPVDENATPDTEAETAEDGGDEARAAPDAAQAPAQDAARDDATPEEGAAEYIAATGEAADEGVTPDDATPEAPTGDAAGAEDPATSSESAPDADTETIADNAEEAEVGGDTVPAPEVETITDVPGSSGDDVEGEEGEEAPAAAMAEETVVEEDPTPEVTDAEAPGSDAEADTQSTSEATDPEDTETGDTPASEVSGDAPATEGEDESETAATDAEGIAPAPPLDVPALRPRARPAIVVHPDLEGVRPRPRPANLPDAPSTE